MSFESPFLKAFLAGSLSGTFSTVLFQPLDLVKTRLQNAPATTGPASNMFNIISSILRKEHLTGLWKGMAPSITRTIPGVGLYFSSMHWMTNTFTDGKPTAIQAVTIGIAGRTFSAVSLIPITVIKTRFESGEFKYQSMSQALKTIYKKEGMKGLTCGLLPTLARDAPFSGIYLMFYSQLKDAVPKELLPNEFHGMAQFGCGIVAGICASVVTQPADVIKTKMQLYPNKYPNISSTVIHLHEKYGIQGYFKGIAPRMIRRTLMASMAWTLYEQATKAMGLK